MQRPVKLLVLNIYFVFSLISLNTASTSLQSDSSDPGFRSGTSWKNGICSFPSILSGSETGELSWAPEMKSHFSSLFVLSLLWWWNVLKKCAFVLGHESGMEVISEMFPFGAEVSLHRQARLAYRHNINQKDRTMSTSGSRELKACNVSVARTVVILLLLPTQNIIKREPLDCMAVMLQRTFIISFYIYSFIQSKHHANY